MTSRWCKTCSAELQPGDVYAEAYGGNCRDCGDPTNIEYQVHDDEDWQYAGVPGVRLSVDSADRAASLAIARAMSHGGPVCIDVLAYSRAAAYAYGCGEDYDDDPDASVTQRIIVRAENIGRVA